MDLDWMLTDEEWKGAVFAADDPKTGEFWDRLFTVVQSKTLEEWQAIFDKNHDVWAETMRRGSELLDHPQMQHLGAVVEIADASYGTVRQPGPIVKAVRYSCHPGTWCTSTQQRRGRAARSSMDGEIGPRA